MNKVKHQVYTSIDAILDTRIAILGYHYPEVVADILNKGAWHTRLHSDLRRLDPRLQSMDWDVLWAERDANLLPLCMLTYVPSTIHRLAMDYSTNGPRMGIEGEVLLTLNTYPYELVDEEREEFRTIFMQNYGCAEVRFVSYPLEFLTYDVISSFDTVIMDDFNAWHDRHGNGLQGKGLPSVKVNAPLLLQRDGPPMPPEMLARAVGMTFQDIFLLELVPVKEFSLIAREDTEIRDATPPPE